MATIGGHGFGAKVAAATAINHLDRFTGLIQYEGGPVNQKNHEAYQELSEFIKCAASLNLAEHDANSATKAIDTHITDKKWASIFKQALDTSGSSLSWKVNMEALGEDVKLRVSRTAHWGPSYGLWPGQTLALFAAHSRWIHLATNTLPFYNVMPRLQNGFPGKINTWAEGLTGPGTHWMHEHSAGEPDLLRSFMARWLKNHDGVNVLLSNRTEVGRVFLPDRGQCPKAGTGGEYMPEHVHHDYKHTDAYEQSR